MFKKIFGRKGNEDITKAFLSTILEDKITSISLDKNTILEKDFKEDKIGVVDISTVINGYINADIEMQVVNNKDIEKRILWYWSKLYSNGIKKGENYKILHRTIVILITNYELDVTKEIEKYFTKWSIREAGYTNVILTKDLEFFIIELPKLRKNKTNTKLDKWVNFIERPSQVDIMNEEDEALKKAREILEDMSKDEHERYIASLREKYILDQNSIHTFYRLETAHTDYYHIDVMDGKFVENNTEELMRKYSDNIKNITNIPLDVHLMVEDVKEFVNEFAPNNPRIITFHIEKNIKSELRSKEEVLELIKYTKEQNAMVGLAVNPETDIENVYEYLPLIHNVLIMSVHPGKGGQSFIEETIEKIKKLSEYIKENNLDNEIEVDGGINDENAIKLKENGVNIIVVGSFLINSKDYKFTVDNLKGLGE